MVPGHLARGVETVEGVAELVAVERVCRPVVATAAAAEERPLGERVEGVALVAPAAAPREGLPEAVLLDGPEELVVVNPSRPGGGNIGSK